MPLNFTFNISGPVVITDPRVLSWIGYSLDDKSNVTIAGNTTLYNLTQGIHSVVVYANDTEGNMGSSNKIFFYENLCPYSRSRSTYCRV